MVSQNIKDIDTIKKSQEDIHFIKGYLIKYSLAETKSPMGLTKKGDRVSKEINAIEIVQNHWSKILAEIKLDKITKESSLYDIQKVCFRIGENYSKILDDKELERVKDNAFDNGLDLFNYNILFGITIRDKFFEQNNLKIDRLN